MNKIFLFNDFGNLDKEIFDFFYKYLKEEKKIVSYRFQKDRRLNLMSSIFLDYLLRIQYNFNSYEIEYNEYEKPYIKNSTLFYNISHCDGFLVIAFSDSEIGVDIEKIDYNLDLKLMSSILSAEEKKKLNRLESKKEKHEYFFKIWTLKESYLKKKGIGLIDDLHNISFDIIDKKWYEGNNQDLSFYQTKLEADYYLSICGRKKEWDLVFLDLKTIYSTW